MALRGIWCDSRGILLPLVVVDMSLNTIKDNYCLGHVQFCPQLQQLHVGQLHNEWLPFGLHLPSGQPPLQPDVIMMMLANMAKIMCFIGWFSYVFVGRGFMKNVIFLIFALDE